MTSLYTAEFKNLNFLLMLLKIDIETMYALMAGQYKTRQEMFQQSDLKIGHKEAIIDRGLITYVTTDFHRLGENRYKNLKMIAADAKEGWVFIFQFDNDFYR